jgi:hypothetical protein
VRPWSQASTSHTWTGTFLGLIHHHLHRQKMRIFQCSGNVKISIILKGKPSPESLEIFKILCMRLDRLLSQGLTASPPPPPSDCGHENCPRNPFNLMCLNELHSKGCWPSCQVYSPVFLTRRSGQQPHQQGITVSHNVLVFPILFSALVGLGPQSTQFLERVLHLLGV